MTQWDEIGKLLIYKGISQKEWRARDDQSGRWVEVITVV
jgi:hypothetical protein